MVGELPNGFTIDQPTSGGSLPPGFTVDALPSGFSVDSPAPPSPQDLMSRTGSDVSQRIQNLQGIQNQVDTGKISAPSGFLQRMGQVAGAGVIDPSTEIAKSAASYIPDAVKNAASGTVNYLNREAQSIPGMQAYQGAVQKASPTMAAFGAAHPEAVGDIKAALDVGSILPIGAAEKATADAAATGLGAARNKINAMSDAAFDKKITPNDLSQSEISKQSSQNWYNTTAKSMPFNNDQASKLQSVLENLEPNTKTQQYLWNKSGAAEKANIIKDSISNGQYTLGDAIDMHSDLNAAIRQAYLAKNDTAAAKLGKVKDALVDAMQNHDGSYPWQMANHEFSKGAAQQTLEEMVAKASTKAQPSNSLDTSLNNFLNSRKSAGLSPNEREALKNVVNNEGFTNTLKGEAASRLTKLGTAAVLSNFGAAGKGAGYLLGSYGSKIARESAFNSKLAKMDEVYSAINNRALPVKPPVSGRALVPAGQVVNHMTDDQIAHARARLGAKGGSGGGNPMYSGAPIAPQVLPLGSPTDPLQGAPIDKDAMYGMEEQEPYVGAYDYPGKPQIGRISGPYDYPKKKTGGKIGFNLKKKNK